MDKIRLIPLETENYLKVAGEINRFKILHILKPKERCVCEIFKLLGLPQNLASHHLKVLKRFGLLKSRRRGLKIIYSRNEKLLAKHQSLFNNAIER